MFRRDFELYDHGTTALILGGANKHLERGGWGNLPACGTHHLLASVYHIRLQIYLLKAHSRISHMKQVCNQHTALFGGAFAVYNKPNCQSTLTQFLLDILCHLGQFLVACRYQCFFSCQLSQVQGYKIMNVMLCSFELLLLVHEGLMTK